LKEPRPTPRGYAADGSGHAAFVGVQRRNGGV